MDFFLLAFLNSDENLKKVFGVTFNLEREGAQTSECLPMIKVDQMATVTEALNERRRSIDLHTLPDIINIGINRFVVNNVGQSVFLRKNVQINKYIQLGNKTFKAVGIILHTGTEVKGHFQSIVFPNDIFYYCNDDSIQQVAPRGVNNEYLTKHATLITYQITDEEFRPDILSLPTISHDDASPSIEKPKNVFMPTEIESDKIAMSPHPIHMSITELIQTYNLVVPNKNLKTNLQEHYKGIHGFLDIDIEGAPTKDFGPESAKYQNNANVLATICRILGRLPFNYHVTQGETNAAEVIHKLNIHALIPSQEQVFDAANAVRDIYHRYKDNANYQEEDILSEITNALQPLLREMEYEEDAIDAQQEGESNITSTQMSNPNGDNEDELFLTGLSKKYKWHERLEDFGEDTIDEILKKIHHEEEETLTSDQQKRLNLKEKFIHEYDNHAAEYKSPRDFILSFIKRRETTCGDNEINYSERQYYEILTEYLNTGEIPSVKKRGGNPGKVTKETLECLIVTVLDFPDATDHERAEYLNEMGPHQNNKISESTVNRILNKLNITIQTPCFSPRERNSLGYRIARVLWAEVMESLASDSSCLLCFIDEASVVLGRRKKARGFVSIRPCVTKTLNSKTLSIVSCIIPNFGTISKWFDSSVKTEDYALFLREAYHIIRTKICNEGTNIIFIQDNASIHKTEEVKKVAHENKINLFYTVPYSPQLNLLAENYFSQLKEVSLNRFKALDNENVQQFPIQHSHSLAKHRIIQQWDVETSNFYDYKNSSKVYGAWLNVLDMCKQGMPLFGIHIPTKEGFSIETVHSLVSCRRRQPDQSSSSPSQRN